MQDDEINGNVSAIARMYGPDVQVNPNERNRFFGNQDLDREYTRFDIQPLKNWKADFSTLALKGSQDSGSVETINIQGKNAAMTYRREDLGHLADHR